MKFTEDQTEQEIFNTLISRETTFKIKCIKFKEDLIVGTVKERERKCRARAKVLVKLVEEC
jgi:hypothetical protein